MAVEFQDYYKTLGVARDATADQISKAFRKLARKYHPDVNKNKDAEDKFKELNEAHEVLKDPETRKRYDALGANYKAGQQFSPPPDYEEFFRSFGGGPQGNGGEFQYQSGPFESSGAGMGGFSDFFQTLFGEGRMGGGQTGRSRTSRGSMPQNGSDLEATLTVSLDEVARNAAKSVSLETSSLDERGMPQVERKSYQITIPPGVTDGKTIRLAGQGGKGSGGGRDGDLLLKLQFAKHPWFWTEGQTVLTKLSITAWEAALGAKVPVQTLEGQVSLRIPPGAQCGQSLRLKGKGLPITKSQRADMLVQLVIAVPKELTAVERELFEQLQRDSSFIPPRRQESQG